MDEQPSKLWRLALAVSLILFAVTCYFKISPFRQMVDAECPWVKEQFAKRGIKFADAPAKAPVKASKATGLESNIPAVFYKR